MRTKYIQHKTKLRIPGVGIGIQVSDHCEKIHCVLDEQSQAVVSDIKLSNICKVKPTFNFFEKTAAKSKSYTDSKMLCGVEIGGVTNSTVQLSSKGSNAGDHIEHYGLGSCNIHHYGGPKIWFIKPPHQFIPAIMRMAELSENVTFPKGIIGVCGLNLTHRDIQYNPSMLGVYYETVKQVKGDLIFVHPSSIHSIFNEEHNLAESRNILPRHPKYLHNIASYKVCCHTEELSGKPAEALFRGLTEHCPISEYIHFSDPSKPYKLELIKVLNDVKDNHQYIKEVVGHVKKSNEVLNMFKFLLPYQKITKDVDKKRFWCTHCEYSSDYYGNLNRHAKKTHRHQAPENTNEEKCMICSSRSHKECKKTKKVI